MKNLYRPNVGILVVNHQGLVLMCARAGMTSYQWQFPQGGIEKNEDAVEAAKRELYEETGIENVQFRHMMPNKLKYDFPCNIKLKYSREYIGQEQQWVLFEFFGEDKDINFEVNPEEIEFKAYEWVELNEAPKRIVAFKKQVYKKVADYFTPFIEEIKNERKI